MFDYLVQQWSEWTIASAVTAAVWRTGYVYATSAMVRSEQAGHTAGTHGIDVETGWLPLAELQGYGAVRWIMVLGEFRSAHDLRIRIAYNYKESDAGGPVWVDDKYIAASPAVIGGPLQLRHGPRYHRCEAIKVRLTAYATGSTTVAPAGEALKLTGLSLEIGTKRGLFKGLPKAQKQ